MSWDWNTANLLVNLRSTLSKSAIFLVSVRLQRELQYSIWLATRVFSNVSIGCRALGLNVLGTHLAIRCPAAAVFDVCVKFCVGGHECTKVSDAVFLFNQSPSWSTV